MEAIYAGMIAQSGFEKDIVDVNVVVPNPTKPGEALTELDVQLQFAIVEIKTGKEVVDSKQIGNQKSLGLPVLVYAPRATADDLNRIRDLGADPFTNFELLIKTLGNLKRESVSSKLKFPRPSKPPFAQQEPPPK
jgi:hypothetical protein